MGRYDISVSNSGGGAGQTFDGLPAMLISDTLFVFDLNPTVVEKLKEFYSNHYIGMTTILQLERYKDDSLFEEGLKELINYAIFYNQDLCDKVFVLGTKDSHIEIANKLAASEQKAITKFRGRKWPDTESFSKLFLPISGCGSVSPSPEKMDMNNLVSWFFEIGYKEEMTTTEFPFDPETQELPIPLEPGVPMPPIPEPPSSGGGEEGGGTVTYSVIYYEWNEYTTFPIMENSAKPMANLVMANSKPQNTISAHVRKQDHLEIVANVSSGGE